MSPLFRISIILHIYTYFLFIFSYKLPVLAAAPDSSIILHCHFSYLPILLFRKLVTSYLFHIFFIHDILLSNTYFPNILIIYFLARVVLRYHFWVTSSFFLSILISFLFSLIHLSSLQLQTFSYRPSFSYINLHKPPFFLKIINLIIFIVFYLLLSSWQLKSLSSQFLFYLFLCVSDVFSLLTSIFCSYIILVSIFYLNLLSSLQLQTTLPLHVYIFIFILLIPFYMYSINLHTRIFNDPSYILTNDLLMYFTISTLYLHFINIFLIIFPCQTFNYSYNPSYYTLYSSEIFCT